MPERWLVQPKVVPMHVLQDPQRRYLPSLLAERHGKNISTYKAAPHTIKGRMAVVTMNSPDDVGLRILQWILVAGDRRYWSWSAIKAQASGNIRASLQYELGVSRSNLARALRKLLDDGIVQIGKRQDGREWIAVTDLGRIMFAEIDWRWKLMECVPELEPMAANYGWQEISVQVAQKMLVDGYDETRRADIIAAAKEQLKDGVENGGPIRLPASWSG